jgi:glucan phosphoethanolaminetransferase (alkaline phosphatase superfamily)
MLNTIFKSSFTYCISSIVSLWFFSYLEGSSEPGHSWTFHPVFYVAITHFISINTIAQTNIYEAKALPDNKTLWAIVGAITISPLIVWTIFFQISPHVWPSPLDFMGNLTTSLAVLALYVILAAQLNYLMFWNAAWVSLEYLPVSKPPAQTPIAPHQAPP